MTTEFDWDEIEVSEIIEGLTAVMLTPVVLPLAAGINQPLAKKTIKEAIAQPQGVAVYVPEKIIRAMDLFLVLVNVNLIGVHFFGGVNSLGLLNWIMQE